jgi:nitric oxide reductase activation protein
VFEAAAPSGEAARIDRLLERHALLAKQIKRLIDRLKPQLRKRLRHQLDGDAFDLDHLIGNWIDRLAGSQPDGRVYQTHQTDGRDIAVLLLLDLSESLKKVPPGCAEPLLALEQEAVTLLAWAVEALGDPFAIAGFTSDTRHEVRVLAYKGFDEPWGSDAKGRLAAMAAGGSTRMGAALRHAGQHLAQRREAKKLLLLLSDGEPSDVDVDDPAYLKWDTHAAVTELRAKGVNTFCITLDDRADDYVADIFGPGGYAVVDQVARLPEMLSRLFMTLTK